MPCARMIGRNMQWWPFSDKSAAVDRPDGGDDQQEREAKRTSQVSVTGLGNLSMNLQFLPMLGFSRMARPLPWPGSFIRQTIWRDEPNDSAKNMETETSR